jgi:sugar phosphate isomerase/epimerase
MQYIGHTMGVPGRSLAEAAQVFSAIGCSGMEVIMREQHPFAPDIPDEQAAAAAALAADAGVPITTITPYAWDINHADPEVQVAHCNLLSRAINLASITGASYIRVFGGREDAADPSGAAARATESLHAAGEYAALKDKIILIENHPGTIARTGLDTARLLQAVGIASVRALYDPANVMHDTDEDWQATLDAQLDQIEYVHVKDFYYDNAGERHACNVGDGTVPWAEILPQLIEADFDGCLSFEYEKLWNPDDLTDAEEGMAVSIDFIRDLIDN